MPSFATNGTLLATQTLNGSENGLLGQNGAILVLDNFGVNALGNNDLAIHGTIASNQTAVNSNGSSLEFVLGTLGSILSTGSYGVLSGVTATSELVIHGSIATSNAAGVRLTHSDGGATLEVVNTGSISGASSGLEILPGDGTGLVVNSGTISGTLNGINVNSTTSGSITINNTGTISGTSFSYIGGTNSDMGSDRVVNSGLMDGGIRLLDGDDIYDGRYGVVTGDVEGGNGNDTLLGGTADDILDGGADNDEIQGGGGDDGLFGSNGNDLLVGGDGNDTLDGGTNEDTLLGGLGDDSLLGMNGGDELDGGRNDDTLEGGVGTDTLLGGANEDRLFGESGNDSLEGNNGHDLLDGGANNDTLDGGHGADTLRGGGNEDDLQGGAHNDELFGDNGADTLDGGTGDDTLTGGNSSDTFVFVGAFGSDRITDFDALNNNEDIDLSGVGSITNFTDLQANHMTQVGADVLIDDLLGNTIIVENVLLTDLNAADFLF